MKETNLNLRQFEFIKKMLSKMTSGMESAIERRNQLESILSKGTYSEKDKIFILRRKHWYINYWIPNAKRSRWSQEMEKKAMLTDGYWYSNPMREYRKSILGN